MNRIISVTTAILATFITGWGWSSSAPKCGDDDVVALVASTLLESIGAVLDENTITLPMMGTLTIEEFERMANMNLESIRERSYDGNVNKRFCASEFSASPDNMTLVLILSGLNKFIGTVNYSVQIIDDGSLFVYVGE